MFTDLLAPKDAAIALGISTATITRCVKRGAPVHTWGSTGRCYRINVTEFAEWMERQRPASSPKPIPAVRRTQTHIMAAARRAHVQALGQKQPDQKQPERRPAK